VLQPTDTIQADLSSKTLQNSMTYQTTQHWWVLLVSHTNQGISITFTKEKQKSVKITSMKTLGKSIGYIHYNERDSMN